MIAVLCMVFSSFAQIPENLNVQTITEEGKTDEFFPYTMTIEYLPATGETFFTFSINMDLFEKSTAMVTIRDRAEQFLKETKADDGVDQRYYAYSYRGADSTKYDSANKIVHYTSRIRFEEVRTSLY